MAKAAQETKKLADKQSIRSELELLRAANELVDLNASIDREFELSAILERQGQSPAIQFNDVKGYQGPVVGNLLSSRRKMALLLGIPESELLSTLVQAIDHPIPNAAGNDIAGTARYQQCSREFRPKITSCCFVEACDRDFHRIVWHRLSPSQRSAAGRPFF